MGWDIVMKIIGSVGGAGFIIAAVVKFCANNIAEQLKKKYDLEMSKQLENHKASLENKTYISRTRFDAEFDIYRNLSTAFFVAIKEVTTLIPFGLHHEPTDKKIKQDMDRENHSRAFSSVVNAQDALFANSPFISKDIFDAYNNILNDCRIQLRVFENRWNTAYIAPQEEKEHLSLEDRKRSQGITEKHNQLNNDIREYLSSLEVIE